MSVPEQRTEAQPHFVIVGFDALAYRLAEQLTNRYDADVVVLMSSEQQRTARPFGRLPRAQVVVADADTDALVAAGIATAAGVALTAQDDVGNIHLALQVREAAPWLRVVIRMYNTSLAHSIEPLLGNCKVISDAEIAAPALVASVMKEVAANPVRVGKRTLVVARRADVADRYVVCSLADTTAPGGPAVLPAGHTADLVLADQHGLPDLESSFQPGAATVRRRRFDAVRTFLATITSRTSRIAIATVLAVIAFTAVALGISMRTGPGESFYEAMATVLGGPQVDRTFTPWQKVLQLILGGAGLAMVPLVTAVIVEGMVRARLAVAQVRLRRLPAGHIVVAGLGGVGSRVLRILHDRGVTVVGIAHDELARGVAAARELGIPLVVGDPGREATLRAAGVERARALMAVTSSDASNLETALHARNLQAGLHVVLRLFDGDLARRVRRTFNLPFSRSVSYLAAPAFAEALLDRDVIIGTIVVERRVLLVADIIVAAHSVLAGRSVGEVDEDGRVRVIAVNEFGEPRPVWNPPPAKTLRVDDRLTVIVIRDGLTRLIQSASAPAPAM